MPPIIVGDCREVMARMDASSVDAVLCDPPYEIAFMSKPWDQRGVAFDPATWATVLRVVKPVALMRWLVRLVTPPGGERPGLVLDPFCGSGTTGVAAALEGVAFIGIEQSEEYAAIAEARIAHALGPLFAAVAD